MTDITTSKRSETVSSESVAAPQDLIDELPESLLVEILCRLPRNTIIQCKSVSKYWSTLISQPCFHAYFLSLQKRSPPLESMLLFVHTAAHEIELFTFPREQIRVSKTHKSHQTYKVWAGTCNDLVLHCATPTFQRYCYYISNSYTKHCVTLPPAPQCHQAHVLVGLICDSYHRCKVVRILECEKESALFKVEIFSSETYEWTQAVVPFPQDLTYDDFRSSVDNVAIACNGTLYWLVSNGLVIALDPSECDNICSFISKPDVAAGLSASSSCEQCLTVSGGRLRLCQFYNELPCPIFYVWDLKENVHEVDGVGGKKVQWCLKEKIVLDKFMARMYWKPLALDPNDEDILYTLLYYPRKNSEDSLLCKQNIRKFALVFPMLCKRMPVQNRIEAFPIVMPRQRLPTPVPRVDIYQEKICDSLRFGEKNGSPI
ncbi:PREDICTED: F-box protein At3g26010-like [Fragaria vesca subsp. vesca]